MTLEANQGETFSVTVVNMLEVAIGMHWLVRLQPDSLPVPGKAGHANAHLQGTGFTNAERLSSIVLRYTN